MAHEVKIPAAGESINSATIGQWHKADGETVAQGDLLATIETDKVSSELEAEIGGIIRIMVPEGEEVAIGTVIAEIGEEVEMNSADSPVVLKVAGEGKSEEGGSPEASSEADTAGDESEPFGFTVLDEKPEVIDIKVPAAGESIASATIAQWHKRDGEGVREGETLVTLETDKVSAELDAEADGVLDILSPEGMEVAIGAVIGTLTVGALPTAMATPSVSEEEKAEATSLPDTVPPARQEDDSPATDPASSAAAVLRSSSLSGEEASSRLKPDFSVAPEALRREEVNPVSDGRITRRRMSSLRRKIATQLVNAQQTAAILTTFNEVDLYEVKALRTRYRDAFEKAHGVRLGFMSFFVKACVEALKRFPIINAAVEDTDILYHDYYDIGIAVSSPRGLVVPVLRDAERLGLAEIETSIAAFGDRARSGALSLDDLTGGTFTITNGGVFGSMLSTPILNPPQSAILGMHKIQDRSVVLDDAIVIRPMMYLALSYDHRIIDGADAVSFLVAIKEALEDPARLLLEV